MKNYQNSPNFTWDLPEKYFSQNLGDGGQMLPAPVSYAYGENFANFNEFYNVYERTEERFNANYFTGEYARQERRYMLL